MKNKNIHYKSGDVVTTEYEKTKIRYWKLKEDFIYCLKKPSASFRAIESSKDGCEVLKTIKKTTKIIYTVFIYETEHTKIFPHSINRRILLIERNEKEKAEI